MEHIIRQKRTLLIVGADEDDVRDFVASARAPSRAPTSENGWLEQPSVTTATVVSTTITRCR